MPIVGEPVGKAIVELGLDDKAYVKGLKGAEKSLERFDKNTQQAVKNVSKSFALGGAAIGAGLGVTIAKFGEFEKSMKNVQAVAGATAEQYVRLKDFALEMGSQTVFSAREAGEAMYFLASAGQSVEQQMATTASVLDLAAATQSELAASASIIVNNLSAFELAADQSRRVADIFAESISSSQANLQKLAISLPRTATVFNDLNQSIETNVAALSLLFDRGVRASTAATGLRNNLLELLDPTDEARLALADMGLTVEELNPQMNSLVDIVERLEQAGFDTADSVKIFGKESNALAVLAGAGAEKLREFEESLLGAAGAAEKMKDIQLDSLTGDLKLLTSATEGAAIAFGEGLAPAIRLAARQTTDLISVFNALPQPVKSALSILTASVTLLVGGLGLLGLIVPKVKGGFGELSKFVRLVGTDISILTERVGSFITGFGTLGTFLIALTAGIPAGMAVFAAGLKLGTNAIDDTKESALRLTEAIKIQRSNVKKIQVGIEEWNEKLEFWNKELKDGTTNIQRLDKATGEWIDIPVALWISIIEDAIADLNKELRLAQGDFREVVPAAKEFGDAVTESAEEASVAWEKLLEETNRGTTEYANFYDQLIASFTGWTSITGAGYRASTAAQVVYLDELLKLVEKESTAWIGLNNLRADLRDQDILDAVITAKQRSAIQTGVLDKQLKQLIIAAEAEQAALLTIQDEGLAKLKKARDEDLKTLVTIPETEPKELIFFRDDPGDIGDAFREVQSVVRKEVDDTNRIMGEVTDEQINAAERKAGAEAKVLKTSLTAQEAAARKVQQAWKRTTENIKRSFEDLFVGLFDDALLDWENFLNDLKRLFAREFFGEVVDRLFPGGGRGGGTGGDGGGGGLRGAIEGAAVATGIDRAINRVFPKAGVSKAAGAGGAGAGAAAFAGDVPAGFFGQAGFGEPLGVGALGPVPAGELGTAASIGQVAIPVAVVAGIVHGGIRTISAFLRHREIAEKVRTGEIIPRRRGGRRGIEDIERNIRVGEEVRVNQAALARGEVIRIDRMDINFGSDIRNMTQPEVDEIVFRKLAPAFARASRRDPGSRRRGRR